MIQAFRKGILFLPVIIGGFIYIIFRSERLVMFRWFEYLNISNKISNIQNLRNISSFPNWFIYSLPDGLWIFSYTTISIEIWKHTITKQNIFWIFSIPIIAVLSEFLQFLKLIPGTFDPIDLAFYLLGIIPLYYTTLKIIFNSIKYEKL